MDARGCERLSPQAITTVSGTRVQGVSPSGPAVAASAARSVDQVQRDGMARSIVSAELAQAQRRHADLLAEYRQGEPLKSPEELQSAAQYQERVARLKAAVERSQRDLDSLQRELTRRP